MAAPRFPEMEPGLVAGPAAMLPMMVPGKFPFASLSSRLALVLVVQPAKLNVTVTFELGHTGVPVVRVAVLGCANTRPLNKRTGNMARKHLGSIAFFIELLVLGCGYVSTGYFLLVVAVGEVVDPMPVTVFRTKTNTLPVVARG